MYDLNPADIGGRHLRLRDVGHPTGRLARAAIEVMAARIFLSRSPAGSWASRSPAFTSTATGPFAAVGPPRVAELSDRKKWNTRLELANAIFEYLGIWHSRKSRHSQLRSPTPIQFERDRITTVA